MSNTASRLPSLPWWFTGLAAALVLAAGAYLGLAGGLNSRTPWIGETFFAAAGALPLAITGLVLELVLAKRRAPPLPKRRRAVHWAVTGLVILAALPTAGLALLAAIFPTC